MKSFMGVIAAAVFNLALGGCGAMPEEEAASSEPAVAAQTAEQVVVCPDPKSCAGWSSWYNLGAPVCQSAVPGCGVEICRPCHCTLDGCDECCTVRPGPASQQKQESFRDCTLQNRQRCREYREQTITLGCGC
jgi:hypothetical protein